MLRPSHQDKDKASGRSVRFDKSSGSNHSNNNNNNSIDNSNRSNNNGNNITINKNSNHDGSVNNPNTEVSQNMIESQQSESFSHTSEKAKSMVSELTRDISFPTGAARPYITLDTLDTQNMTINGNGTNDLLQQRQQRQSSSSTITSTIIPFQSSGLLPLQPSSEPSYICNPDTIQPTNIKDQNNNENNVNLLISQSIKNVHFSHEIILKDISQCALFINSAQYSVNNLSKFTKAIDNALSLAVHEPVIMSRFVYCI